MQVELSKSELIQAIRRDCLVVLAFYLGDQLELEVPEMHVEVWDEFLELLDKVNDPAHLTGTLNKLIGIPREHAKTTLVKLAVILFMRYSKLSFTAYVSNTFGSALNAIKDIVDFLTSPQETELYGPAYKEKASESEGIYIYHICVPGTLNRKLVILQAFGWGTQIRGRLVKNRRPDLLIFDDIESHETVDSPIQQSKLDTWALGTAYKSMARKGICIFIGNMLKETSLLARLAKDPDWNAVVFGALIRNKDGSLSPLWPGRWSVEALIKDYYSYRRKGLGHLWEAEMMNLTSKDILGESLASCLRPPRPLPEEIEGGFICLDPAFGEKAIHDSSAITVHVRLIGGDIPIIVETWTGKVNEAGLLDELLRLSYYWGITTWCIESVAAQRLFIPLFRAMLMLRKISPELFLILPITGGTTSKPSRIVALRSSVVAQSYAIAETESDFVTLLETYTPDTVEHDDLCDSAAFGPIAWSMYGSIVTSKGRFDVAGAVMASASNEGVSLGSLELGI